VDSKTIESDALIELDEIELAEGRLVAPVILPVLLPLLLLLFLFLIPNFTQYFLISDEAERSGLAWKAGGSGNPQGTKTAGPYAGAPRCGLGPAM